MDNLQDKSNKITMGKVNMGNDNSFPKLEKNFNGNLKFMPWGKGNKMPYELFDYYTKCSEHHSIIDTCVNMMVGNGIEQVGSYSNRTQNFIDHPNQFESLDSVSKKLSLDFKIYGVAYLEVIYSNDRQSVTVEQIDASKVRWCRKYKGRLIEVGVSDNWFSSSSKKEIYPVYNPKLKNEHPRQILPIVRYSPMIDYYTLPSYYSGIKWISIDYEISRFHEENIKNGFTPSIYFGFPMGQPTEEEMEANEEGLKSQLGGAGGSFLTSYYEAGSDNKPDVQILQQSDVDSQYEWLSSHTQQEILIAHQVTSENIVGIATPGKLGGTNEMIEAYNIYYNSVVKHEQKYILDALNRIMLDNGMNEIDIKSSAPYIEEDIKEEEEVIDQIEEMSAVNLKIQNSGLPLLYKKGVTLTHNGVDFTVEEDIYDTSKLNFGSVIKASNGSYYELAQDTIDGKTGINENANITDMYIWTLGSGGVSKENCPSCIKHSGKIRTLNSWKSTAIPGTSFASINSYNKSNPDWKFGTFCEDNCSCKLIKIN